MSVAFGRLRQRLRRRASSDHDYYSPMNLNTASGSGIAFASPAMNTRRDADSCRMMIVMRIFI